MATPLSATWRIKFQYAVDGLEHVLHAYARIGTITPTLTLRQRDGVTETLWSDCATGMVGAMSNVLPAAVVWGAQTLEQLSGLVWLPQASAAATAGTAGTYKPATQITAVLRDTGFHKIRLQVMEGVVAAPSHTPGIPGSGFLNALLLPFTVGGSTAGDPYFWMVSRANQYLQDNPVVGTTVDLNDKLRRARGLS